MTKKDVLLCCPECSSPEVAATAEEMWLVNTGEHYCHSVKDYDSDAKAECLQCEWSGRRKDLIGSAE